MKLPELKESKPIELTLGGYQLKFRKYRVSDSIPLSKFNSDMSQEQRMVAVIALLLDGYEDSLADRIKFIERINLDSIEELFSVAKVLGYDESGINAGDDTIKKNTPRKKSVV
jgi:hypothetical protein